MQLKLKISRCLIHKAILINLILNKLINQIFHTELQLNKANLIDTEGIFFRFGLTVPRRYFICGSVVLFMSCVCQAFTSVHCCLVVTCWEKADLLALVGDVYCIFVTFPCGILGQVWYLIVFIPDHCWLSYVYAFISLNECYYQRERKRE